MTDNGDICELDVTAIAALIVVFCRVDEDLAIKAAERILRYVVERLTKAGAHVVTDQ